MIELTRTHEIHTEWKVKILGIGGAGTHAVDRLTRDGLAGVELMAANTDARALSSAATADRIILGQSLTRGLGAGGDPELGSAAAREAGGVLADRLRGGSLVVLLAGLGGGTGSGAAPVIARQARELGAHVAVFATLPFTFEGRRRREQALEALDALRANADLVICFENDRMPSVSDPASGIEDAFEAVDSLLAQAVRAMISMTKRRNVLHSGLDEIAATVAEPRSTALFGYGAADGEERARSAVAKAFSNPLLDAGGALSRVSRLWVYVAGGADMRWSEVQALMQGVTERVSSEVRLFFGAAVDPQMAGAISVTLLAGVPDETASSGVSSASVGELSRPVSARYAAPSATSAAHGGWEEPAEEYHPREFRAPAETQYASAQTHYASEEPYQAEPAQEHAQDWSDPEAADTYRTSGSELAFSREAEPQRMDPAPTGHWEDSHGGGEAFHDEPVAPASVWSEEERTHAPQNQQVTPEPVASRSVPTPPFELSKERRLQETAQMQSFSRAPREDIREHAAPVSESSEVIAHKEPSFPIEQAPAVFQDTRQAADVFYQEPPHTSAHSRESFADEQAVASIPSERPLVQAPVPEAPTRTPENGRRSKEGVQEQMRFDSPNKGGRFEKTDPTIVDGEDLDVPTFMRQKLSLDQP